MPGAVTSRAHSPWSGCAYFIALTHSPGPGDGGGWTFAFCIACCSSRAQLAGFGDRVAHLQQEVLLLDEVGDGDAVLQHVGIDPHLEASSSERGSLDGPPVPMIRRARVLARRRERTAVVQR